MRSYEVMYILHPESLEEELKELIDRFKGVVEKGKGEVMEVNSWGKKKFAYPIEKLTEGYYVVMNFKSEPIVASELSRQLRINDKVVRHLLVKLEEEE